MQRQVADEIIVPVISFLVLVAGLLGILSFFQAPTLEILSLLAFMTSIIAIPGGVLLAKYQHLGWLMSLVVIGVSELLILITHISVNNGLDPVFFLVFTSFYCAQAYYLIVRRELFDYPTFHPRHKGHL